MGLVISEWFGRLEYSNYREKVLLFVDQKRKLESALENISFVTLINYEVNINVTSILQKINKNIYVFNNGQKIR